MIITHLYQPDHGVTRREGIEPFDELIKSTNQVFWVDFLQPTDDAIAEQAGPKVDDYDTYLFVDFYIAEYDVEHGLTSRAVHVFLLQNGVVTVRDEQIRPLDAVARRCRTEERVLSRGADFFFHALLDHMVDHYDHTLERIEDEVDRVEDEVFRDPEESVMRRVFNLKRDLSHLKRIVTPMREMLDRFSRSRFKLIASKARVYFRDVFDHVQRINDLADSYRDTLSGTRDCGRRWPPRPYHFLDKVIDRSLARCVLCESTLAGRASHARYRTADSAQTLGL